MQSQIPQLKIYSAKHNVFSFPHLGDESCPLSTQTQCERLCFDEAQRCNNYQYCENGADEEGCGKYQYVQN